MRKLISTCAVIVLFISSYARAGTWTTLDKPGTLHTSIYGIDGGNLVGWYDDAPNKPHGFLYDGTTLTTLDYPGARYTKIFGIDGSNLVGFYCDSLNNIHSFFYNGTSYTTILGIDHILGIDGINLVGVSSGGHGCLYNGTTWISLDAPGALHTEIYGVDGSDIVGSYGDASGNTHGFLYDGTTWTTLDKPGATGTEIYGIDGSNLVGTYYDVSGSHGFIYTIPEPATLLLLGLGAVMVRKKR